MIHANDVASKMESHLIEIYFEINVGFTASEIE